MKNNAKPYTRLAEVYDALYTGMGKDYAAECETLHRLITQSKRSQGHQLLDVACGTGGHLVFLGQVYTAEGLDRSAEMIAVARRRLPDLPIHQASMVDFQLGRRFDVITCLFASIGLVKTVEHLQRAVGTMVSHLQPGGVLIIEPWLYPEFFHPGTVHAALVDHPDLKIARMIRTMMSELDGRVAVWDTHYLVATPHGVEHFTECYELGLFTHEEYLAAFPADQVTVSYDPAGISGRGLYIGVKQSAAT
jgi:trans-aconitate methyltransferase